MSAKDEVEQTLRTIAEKFSSSLRSPILHTPAELDLDYENVTFPSQDGVPLEGWLIPAPGSDKIVIVNHPRWFSRCLGCNATLFAMEQRPDVFSGVRCLVGCQPLSVRVIMEQGLALAGIPADYIDDLDQLIRLQTSFTLDDMSPVPAAKSVMIPTFLYQVRDDTTTRPSDVQSLYDNLSIDEKHLFWIEGTSRRWDGYTYFAKDPSQMLTWFDKYMS